MYRSDNISQIGIFHRWIRSNVLEINQEMEMGKVFQIWRTDICLQPLVSIDWKVVGESVEHGTHDECLQVG